MASLTRRALIAGGAIAAASALPDILLAQEGQGGNTKTGAVNEKTYPVNVYETDVLVVGAGYAGCMAAFRAMQLGSKVTVLDKGVFGHSGSSGYNWGTMYSPTDFIPDMESRYQTAIMSGIRACSATVDQTVCAAIGTQMVADECTLFMESLGMFHERLEDGTPGTSVAGTVTPLEQGGTASGLYVRFLCQKIMRMGADVHDRTMLVDILRDENGEAGGGVALDLETGMVHVYRAKSVVLATGANVWMCGWHEWKPRTMNGPEATGDSLSILMNHGVPVGNMEFNTTDYDAFGPGCFFDSYVIGLEYPNFQRGVNANGEYFALEYYTENPGQAGIESLTQLVAGEVIHGRGSKHGGVWLDTTNWEGEHVELFYRNAPEQLLKDFGYELPDKIEVIPDHWTSISQPNVDTGMQTAIPGVYFAGYPNMLNGNGIMATGSLAGQSSAMRAATVEKPVFDWAQVDSAVDHIYGILENNPENGIPASEIMQKIQMAYGSGLDFIRNEVGITAALEELKRIQSEDLPKMLVAEKTRVYNIEWRRALEVEKMLDNAIGCAMGALERKESRLHHVREDYPEFNDAEFLAKRLMISKNGGAYSVEKIDVDTSIVNLETLPMLLTSTTSNSREK